jgi:hypothetical protein
MTIPTESGHVGIERLLTPKEAAFYLHMSTSARTC